MLDASSFRLAELVTREELEAHPVWADFHEPLDRALVLGWGVAAERLDAEIEKFAFCGTSLRFPVLACDPLPRRPGLVLAARYRGADGSELDGYVIDEAVYGLFAGPDGREFCLNRFLAGRATHVAAALVEALGGEESRLFPMAWRACLEGAGEGKLERFWGSAE